MKEKDPFDDFFGRDPFEDFFGRGNRRSDPFGEIDHMFNHFDSIFSHFLGDSPFPGSFHGRVIPPSQRQSGPITDINDENERPHLSLINPNVKLPENDPKHNTQSERFSNERHPLYLVSPEKDHVDLSDINPDLNESDTILSGHRTHDGFHGPSTLHKGFRVPYLPNDEGAQNKMVFRSYSQVTTTGPDGKRVVKTTIDDGTGPQTTVETFNNSGQLLNDDDDYSPSYNSPSNPFDHHHNDRFDRSDRSVISRPFFNPFSTFQKWYENVKDESRPSSSSSSSRDGNSLWKSDGFQRGGRGGEEKKGWFHRWWSGEKK